MASALEHIETPGTLTPNPPAQLNTQRRALAGAQVRQAEGVEPGAPAVDIGSKVQVQPAVGLESIHMMEGVERVSPAR